MGAQGCPSRVHWRKKSYGFQSNNAARTYLFFPLQSGRRLFESWTQQREPESFTFFGAKWARDRKLDLLSSSSDVILALGPTTGTGNEKQRTLRKSKGAFLSEISRIMVDQMSRWILVQSGFIGSFDLPWSEWSEITGPDHGIRRRFRRRFQRFNQCRLTWHRRLMMPRTPSNFQRWLNDPIDSYNHLLLWRLPKNQLSKYLLSG